MSCVTLVPTIQPGTNDHCHTLCSYHATISYAKIQLKSLLFPETESLMKQLGEKPGRAEVLFSWLYHDERLIQDVDESAARDDRDRWRPLGKETRKRLRAVATADGGLRLEVGDNVALTHPAEDTQRERDTISVCWCAVGVTFLALLGLDFTVYTKFRV